MVDPGETRQVLNNEKHIVRIKAPLEQSANPDDLCISIPATVWGKLNWKEGTVLEIRQDDIDKNELTIRVAPKSLRDQLGIKRE